jgi:glycosyltransferase involved in cell wall biosynthesis
MPTATTDGRLHIGFNLVYLVEDSAGAGRYALELIGAILKLEPGTRITAWTGSTAPESVHAEPWASEVEWVRLRVPGVGPPWHLAHQLAGMAAGARRRRVDVVHGLANVVPPLHPGVATVATILDLTWMHFPDSMAWRGRVANRILAPLSGRTADRVIAISETVREDLVATLRLPRERIDVTPLGIRLSPLAPPASEAAVRERLGLGPGPVVLVVAQKRPHKNLGGVVRAMAQLSPELDAQLVLPGTPTPYEQTVRALAGELGVSDRVHFPSWITEAELEALYRIASCFVLASLAEGFGLPVLEAMRRGVPVACSNVSSLPEVAGDAAIFFDPRSPQSMAAAISRLLTDAALSANLLERGYARCREFTWERTAALTLASYRRATASSNSAAQA